MSLIAWNIVFYLMVAVSENSWADHRQAAAQQHFNDNPWKCLDFRYKIYLVLST